ncbi:MAG: NAD(P)/FAD-dependent oxidoreductase [Rubrivivax sp.]|nr:NAD(P)/FAD-dependent oxidoreductase [Rubrivivax sp.]MDH5340263.1 NAD(P)/FAD-dependent oxidoreductase [Rubrivivax sp.]
MELQRIDTVVVGAGVVGLAVARRLALAGHEVVVLEATGLIGSATSSRNSEVVHAGLYYPPGSLKARLCVQGREQLVAYAAGHGVPLRRCGKLIVATAPDQAAGLDLIQARARACGVLDLAPLSASQARALEPALRCTAALHSPSTGIVDSHALMLSLRGEAEDHGAMLALHSPVLGGRVRPGGVELEVGGVEPMRVLARQVVNCAGLHAQPLAQRIEGLRAEHVPPQHWARGHYFSLPGRPAFGRLIYPLPVPGGLGTHLTLDLGGQMRFGPDVQWVPTTALGAEDYRVDPGRAAAFEASIRDWWPEMPPGRLQPDYAGLRPKIVPPGAPAGDFRIDGPSVHGVPGLVNLFGIESPGLTACLALADEVAARLAASA